MYASRLLLFFALALPAVSMGQDIAHPLRPGGDVVPPVLVAQPDPKYPRPLLFGRRRTGETLIRLVVDEKGMPVDVSVKKPVDKKLDDAALKAVRQYRFKPAMRNGVPVAVEMTVAVSFSVHQRP